MPLPWWEYEKYEFEVPYDGEFTKKPLINLISINSEQTRHAEEAACEYRLNTKLYQAFEEGVQWQQDE